MIDKILNWFTKENIDRLINAVKAFFRSPNDTTGC